MKYGNKSVGWLILAIILALLHYTINPFLLNHTATLTLSIAILMITLWVTEAYSMPIVALLPLVLFPAFNLASVQDIASPYANSVIFLFMGGFMIGLAIEKWNLHKRIALNIIRFTGTSGNQIILGFILATGLMSMWLSNTATTMMMYPIALSVIQVIEQNNQKEKTRFTSICLMLSIAYASNFGGIATIIGTPPNVAYVAYLKKTFQYEYDFLEWMMIGLPLSLLLMFSLYLVMTKWLFKNNLSHSKEAANLIQDELKRLGPISPQERKVLFIFFLTAFLWISKDLGNQLQHLIKLDDTMIAMMGALLMFIVPANKTENLLGWADTQKMAWGILLLFGGGITLANQLEKVGLIQQLGDWLASFGNASTLMIIIVLTVVSIFISEVTSNVAQVIVFAPVVTSIALALNMNPLLLGLPMTFAASAASMMPMGTPPNAIVFASGKLQLKDMVKTGLVMNLIAIVLITLFTYYIVPYFVTTVQ